MFFGRICVVVSVLVMIHSFHIRLTPTQIHQKKLSHCVMSLNFYLALSCQQLCYKNALCSSAEWNTGPLFLTILIGYSSVTVSVKSCLVKSKGCCLCSIHADYRDKTLMPSDSFPCLTSPTLHHSFLSAPPLFLWTFQSTATHHPPTMKTALTLLLLISLACHCELSTVLMPTLDLGVVIYWLVADSSDKQTLRAQS